MKYGNLHCENMEYAYIEEKTFAKVDFRNNPLNIGDYENCRFLSCDFSNSDLSDRKFTDCEFVECNLSMVKIIKTVFRDVAFKDCKMLGLHFVTCNELGLAFSFENCILSHSTFYKMKIKKTTFKHSLLHEVDFTECDLTDSLFYSCDLTRATFDGTIIEKADFRTSFNFSIDPEINKIKKAKFSLTEIAGLLEKYNLTID